MEIASMNWLFKNISKFVSMSFLNSSGLVKMCKFLLKDRYSSKLSGFKKRLLMRPAKLSWVFFFIEEGSWSRDEKFQIRVQIIVNLELVLEIRELLNFIEQNSDVLASKIDLCLSWKRLHKIIQRQLFFVKREVPQGKRIVVVFNQIVNGLKKQCCFAGSPRPEIWTICRASYPRIKSLKIARCFLYGYL